MLARIVGPIRTRDLMLTGRTLTASEAVEWGMVARMVPHDELMAAAREVLAQCCRTAPGARRVVKSSLDNYLGLYDRIGMEASIESAEAVEGFVAFRNAGPRTGCIPTCASTDGCDDVALIPRPWSHWRCSRCSVCSDLPGALGFSIGERDRPVFAVSAAGLARRNGLPGSASS